MPPGIRAAGEVLGIENDVKKLLFNQYRAIDPGTATARDFMDRF